MCSDTLDFDDEHDFEEWLGGAFETAGWRVYHQVNPEGSRNRADMLVHHERHGWIGIECKYMSNMRDGAKVGEAIKQITQKYRGEYFPHGAGEVDLWAFAAYVDYIGRDVPPGGTSPPALAKPILYEHGIGTLWGNPQFRNHLNIKFNGSATETVINIIDPHDDHLGNTDRIRGEVAKKIPEDYHDLGVCQRNTDGHGCTAPAVAIVESGDYEIHLCKHHFERFEVARWEQQKRDPQTA